MAFQSVVRKNAAFGVPGEIRFDGPLRSQPWTIAPTAQAADCLVGRFFTVNSNLQAVPGGDLATNVMAGILVDPKTYASHGTSSGGSLAPTLQVLPGTVGAFVTMGFVAARCATPASLGDLVHYDKNTGMIGAFADGVPPTGDYEPIPNAVVDRVDGVMAGGMIVIRITN